VDHSPSFLRFSVYLSKRAFVLAMKTLKIGDDLRGAVVSVLLLAGTTVSLVAWWEQYARWWVPVGIFLLLFIYGLLRASYEEVKERRKEYTDLETSKNGELREIRTAHQQIETEKEELEKQLTTAAKRKALKDLLGDAIDVGKSLQSGPHYDAEGNIKKPTEHDIENWVQHIHDLIEAALDKAEARQFLSNTGITYENLYG
jgi:hypothetical protein